jgi:hypothetical protein
MPTDTPAVFDLSPSGYIRHWLVAGPKETPYAGPPGKEHVLRKEALDYTQVVPPSSAALNAPGPFGGTWRFHDPGRNEYVEFSTFYPKLTVLEYYAFTEVVVPATGNRKARFWVAGAADLWVNDEHVVRLNVTRYRNPDCQSVVLPLKEGVNRLCVRLQCLGVRDTRVLFGLSLEKPDGAVVRMRGAERIAQISRWIDRVRPQPDGQGLQSPEPAPLPARVIPVRGTAIEWPAASSTLGFAGQRPPALSVEAEVDGAVLRRDLEIPSNRFAVRSKAPTGDRRQVQLDYIARAGIDGQPPASWNAVVLPLLARRLLGRRAEQDAAALRQALETVDSRRDCADFVLAGLLRLESLRLCSPEESAEIRRAALAFRYWTDEPGSDAMCFTSENHTLLFHGCQLLAGRLYPQEIFSNTGRRGEEQAAIALQRVRKWLDKIEARGFEEFNSSNYIPITIAAMLNVVDFSGDAELSARMAAQVDRIFGDLARHAFAGGIITPQGRVYRNVLYAEESGTQALLAYATDAMDLNQDIRMAERSGDWAAFLASSPTYRPPADLAEKIRQPVSLTYRHADVQIVLEKTPAYVLTSLAVPAVPRDGEHPDNDLRPGGAGYQQHLWQATLGKDCHVFVNHPGGFFDGTKSRPGYWYGNGLLPRVRQKGNWLQAIHVIADGTKTKPPITPDVWQWGSASTARPYDLYPIAFTHAHWPADSFDRQEKRGNWIFGQKGSGLIGLWCSETLTPHDDVLTGRELRANGYSSAWLVICGDLEKEKSLEAFMLSCESRRPAFDRSAFTLSMAGEEKTRWWERSEPMPE